MNLTKHLWGEDIHIGHATLKFATPRLNKKMDEFVASGWIIPGGRRTANVDDAQNICAKMSSLIGTEKPFLPRSK